MSSFLIGLSRKWSVWRKLTCLQPIHQSSKVGVDGVLLKDPGHIFVVPGFKYCIWCTWLQISNIDFHKLRQQGSPRYATFELMKINSSLWTLWWEDFNLRHNLCDQLVPEIFDAPYFTLFTPAPEHRVEVKYFFNNMIMWWLSSIPIISFVIMTF